VLPFALAAKSFMRQVTIKFDESIASSNHVEPDGLVLVFSVLPALCRGGCANRHTTVTNVSPWLRVFHSPNTKKKLEDVCVVGCIKNN
jgi:hypothetical protein